MEGCNLNGALSELVVQFYNLFGGRREGSITIKNNTQHSASLTSVSLNKSKLSDVHSGFVNRNQQGLLYFRPVSCQSVKFLCKRPECLRFLPITFYTQVRSE